MKLLLFLGAGVSVPSDLPTSEDLTKMLFVSRPGESDATTRLRGLLAVIRDYDTADIAKVGMSPQWVFSPNQVDDSVTGFRVGTGGALNFTGQFVPLGSPAAMVFLP